MEELKTSLSLKESIITIVSSVLCCAVFLILLNGHLVAQLILLVLTLYMCTGGRVTYVFAQFKTIPRDAKFSKYLITFIFHIKSSKTVATAFSKTVEKFPNKVAFMMDDKQMTFQMVEDLNNQVAEYFYREKYVKGDVVALMMENRPEYCSFWLGLSKLGVVSALVNTNLRKEMLLHSIKIAHCKAIIVSEDHLDAIIELLHYEEIKNLKIFIYDVTKYEESVLNSYKFINLSKEFETISPKNLTFEAPVLTATDNLVYIYTSGTTGLPKAAIITHLRCFYMSVTPYDMFDIRSDDIVYCTLPLFHSAGGILGTGMVMMIGTTMVMRKKFSASSFWEDCIKYNCTVAQYVGEICRYLYLVPPKPTDTQHKVRVMTGNGLRPQIWAQFVNRFKISKIFEFFGSSEGNSNMVNIDGKVGAVGFVPLFARPFFPAVLVKCDEKTGEPVRNSNGRCIRTKAGEPGVLLGGISKGNAVRAFNGYTDNEATQKKVLKNVFKQGDSYFNSGDILVEDIYGFFYFKDRTGDTFRWRGENVATTEVESVIMSATRLGDCVVYGVEIPGTEGKAGMAAIVDLNNSLDINQLSNHIKNSLPPYARPIFIRVLLEIPITSTFKLKRFELQEEGFDIAKIQDPIYFQNENGMYQKFSMEDYCRVLDGKFRI